MIAIEDLTGIEKDKREGILQCLEDLLLFKDYEGNYASVITGYNFYNRPVKSDRIITFSHIHSLDTYKESMMRDLKDLGYSEKEILNDIRDKIGICIWELDFEIGEGLRIKNVSKKEYVDLKKYKKQLDLYDEFKECKDNFIGEQLGWELDLPFRKKEELFSLVNLFMRKSGKFAYDSLGNQIEESIEERNFRNPWPMAYDTPVLILGATALKYKDALTQFSTAVQFSLKENNNEISFVINNNLPVLEQLPHYKQLLNWGFEKEFCLGNKAFIKEYIDKKRM